MSTSIFDRISPLSERPPAVKMMVYGDPGVGKTVFAASAPGAVIVDTEHGARSLNNHPALRNTPVLPMTSFKDVEDLFWGLKDGEHPEYETIVIDSISELQSRHLDELLKKAAQRDSNRNPYLPMQLDYKENTQVLRRLISQFRDLERNLIITAHSIMDKDESTGAMMYRPAVTPKLSQTLHGLMDVVGYFNVQEEGKGTDTKKIRQMQIEPSRRVTAKCRIGGLPSVIVEPTFDMFLKANAEEN